AVGRERRNPSLVVVAVEGRQLLARVGSVAADAPAGSPGEEGDSVRGEDEILQSARQRLPECPRPRIPEADDVVPPCFRDYRAASGDEPKSRYRGVHRELNGGLESAGNGIAEFGRSGAH